ncbi:MAG TPA: D-alanyl-D-alanine carboxypeptidase/D-alanyl-D-alanine-endopeptidase, partial [Pseudomonas sp.]|nr:D-alanyl-D-alanine carboxypeptidase/D-alanyl-D-alanine-endopeptidase [Pseudomonas sp.]
MSLISSLSAPANRSRATRQLRSRLAAAALTLPLVIPAFAETVNQTLPTRVVQALKTNKIETSALSVVMLPLNGTGSPTFVNADVSV